MAQMFDIVIPVGPNDSKKVIQQLEYTKKNIVGYRHIYLVSFDASLNISGTITIDERIFPFNIMSVASIHGKNGRNGWYLQQLLKLYAGIVIPDILPRYLVIDSDTFFIKPTTFVSDTNKCMYNYGFENHVPYFDHGRRLLPYFRREIANMSGICHHMMFETKYVVEFMNAVLETNKRLSMSFWEIFLHMVSPEHYLHSGASEYELYFNYMIHNHSDEIVIRQLPWKNSNTKRDLTNNKQFNYVSIHWYMDTDK